MDLQQILAMLQGGQGPGGMNPTQMDPQMLKMMQMMQQQQRFKQQGLQDGPVMGSPAMAAQARPPMPPMGGGGPMPAGPGMPAPKPPMGGGMGGPMPGNTMGMSTQNGQMMAQKPDLMSLIMMMLQGQGRKPGM